MNKLFASYQVRTARQGQSGLGLRMLSDTSRLRRMKTRRSLSSKRTANQSADGNSSILSLRHTLTMKMVDGSLR